MSQTRFPSLYIFVTSERPDQYLNSIMHCYFHRGIRTITFLHITGVATNGKGAGASTGVVSLSVSRTVQMLMDHLTKGTYRFFQEPRQDEMVDLSAVYDEKDLMMLKSKYKQCLDADISWANREIKYSELRAELARINKKDAGSLFDVTAVNKVFLGDILSCCIVEGIRNLYTFDLEHEPNFGEPWKMLFHELSDKESQNRLYKYTDVVDTPVFRECSRSLLVRTTPILLAVCIAAILVVTMVVIFLLTNEANRFIQGLFVVAAVSSLLSVVLSFFPPRR